MPMTRRDRVALIATAAVVAIGASLALATPAVADETATPKPHPSAQDRPADPPGRSTPGSTDDRDDHAPATSTPAPPTETPLLDAVLPLDPGPPGDNGTVKVHRSTTPVDDRRNEPKVCTFYLVGFGFDAAQDVRWHIKSWPPTGDRTVVKEGTLVLDEAGHGRTGDMTLPDGHYKLFWDFEGKKGKGPKHKVFWVTCDASPSASPPGTAAPVPSAKPAAARDPGDPGKGGGALPFTGFPAWLLGALALALLAGGTTIVLAARRRT